MNVSHPEGVLHSFSIKNIFDFYDKMDFSCDEMIVEW